jgi:hypothetical protein
MTSCTVERKPAFSEIAGENYTIQVTSLPMHDDDSGTSGYKVRVLPGRKLLDDQGKQLQEGLWYQTDSCFYITQGSASIKPELIQPIATGVANCYEFMLVFDGVSVSGDNEVTLVFNDQNITREKYLIKLIRKLL